MFKILVCGSRETKDKEFVFSKLDYLTSKKSLSEIEIIQGGQKSYDKSLGINYGADYFAKLWAEERKVKMIEFKANWDKYGRSAGPIRNKQMLDYGPDACLGFLKNGAANKGTKNMLKLSQNKGVPTKYYYI